mmetsp:Transcript_30698/g.94834  ORF Transcript_30698/g.94834 Transcript_30698/m.94834 type:complete len:297 (+) Transcript_30698:363-1253(+)
MGVLPPHDQGPLVRRLLPPPARRLARGHDSGRRARRGAERAGVPRREQARRGQVAVRRARRRHVAVAQARRLHRRLHRQRGVRPPYPPRGRGGPQRPDRDARGAAAGRLDRVRHRRHDAVLHDARRRAALLPRVPPRAGDAQGERRAHHGGGRRGVEHRLRQDARGQPPRRRLRLLRVFGGVRARPQGRRRQRPAARRGAQGAQGPAAGRAPARVRRALQRRGRQRQHRCHLDERRRVRQQQGRRHDARQARRLVEHPGAARPRRQDRRRVAVQALPRHRGPRQRPHRGVDHAAQP